MKEIKIGEGFDNVQFGMTKDAFEGLLGKADEIDKFSYADSEPEDNESWHYDSLELSASFDADKDWLLSMLAVSSKDFKLGGHKLIGLDIDEVIEKTQNMNLGESTIEDWSTDESPNYKLLVYDDSSLNFWFDQGKLSEIQWGPLLDEDDEIIWPE